MNGLKPSNKKTTPTTVTNKEIAVIRENVFKPDKLQVQAKIRFYQKTKHTLTDISKLDVEKIIEITGEPRLINWWSMPAFVSWFRNESEHQERVDFLFTMMLNNLEDLIVDPECRYTPSEKLAAQRQLLELKKQMQEKEGQTEYSPEDIQKIVEAIRLRKKQAAMPAQNNRVELPV